MKYDLSPFVGRVVRLKNAIADICEDYAEGGMTARFVSFSVDGHGTEDEFYIITFDFSEFDDQNKMFETANYYDKSGKPTLTAREAGYYKSVDTYYLAPNQIDDTMEILDPVRNALHESFAATKEDGQSYVDWLERQVLAVRRPEALKN